MSDDIVTRLRQFDKDLVEEIVNGDHGKDGEHWVIPFDCLCEAADEIERLQNDLDGSQLAYRGASYDRDRMRAERDEARRWLRDACAEIARIETRFYDALTPQQIAERNGWDCFKEVNP